MKLTPTIRNTAHSEKNRKNINGLENKTNMDPCDIYIFIISFGGPQSIINIKGSLFLINEGLSGMTKCLEHTYTNALPLPIKYIHIYVKAFELLEFNLYYISHSTPLELKFEILKCGIILINYSFPMV